MTKPEGEERSKTQNAQNGARKIVDLTIMSHQLISNYKLDYSQYMSIKDLKQMTYREAFGVSV